MRRRSLWDLFVNRHLRQKDGAICVEAQAVGKDPACDMVRYALGADWSIVEAFFPIFPVFRQKQGVNISENDRKRER